MLVLIFVLVISVSAVSAYDGDNSTVSAADENIEILDTNVDDGSLEMVNDYDQLSYPSSSSDSWIKFDEDDITINEGDSYTIHGTLYTGNSKNTEGNFPIECQLDNNRISTLWLNNGELNLDISSLNLAPSDSKYKIDFIAEDSFEYVVEFIEMGYPEMTNSYVLIKVNDNTPAQYGVVHASVTSNNVGVPNANVVLSAEGSETTYSGIANNQGVCDISDVPYGDYTVTVTANGYEKLTSTVSVNDEETNLGLTLIQTPPVDSMYLSETGVVSGVATLISVNPWATSGTLQYTLPSDIKRVKSAIVIVNSYSGSGNSNNYALHSDVTLTTTATTTLGSEDLYYYGIQTNDPVVYVINDHTTKQYSDYQYVYNITDTVAALNAGSSLTINVANSKFGNYGFDGRIKMITLFLAYDDDDNDKLTYWLEIGQSWTNALGSEFIPTSSYDGEGYYNLTLETIALSSYLAEEYTLYGEELNDPTIILDGSYYKHICWNSEDNFLTDYYMEGDDAEFTFGASQEGWGSYKTNILLFKAFEEEQTGDVYITVYSGSNRINNANVVLSTANGETTYSTTTDDLGYCAFDDIPYGEYTVTITANGYQDFTDTITLDDFEIFREFELTVEDQPEVSTVHASVTSDNVGVPNANVELLDAVSGTTYVGTANRQGVCDIPEVPYGMYTVTVTANGYEKLSSTVTVNGGETNLNLVLTKLAPLDSMYLHETGVVSGDALLISVNPWATSGSLQYALPDDLKNVKSAIVIVNSYSGSGNSNNYALHSDVTLTTTATTTLGSEDLYYYGIQTNDPVVYVINDHTTKQYSDYQYVYNITDTVAALNAGSSLTINVANSKFGDYGYDARIKMITLFLAYDDDDNDELTYWLDVGQSWTNALGSEIIETGSYTGSTDDLKLETIALSSYYAQEYQLNGMILNDPTEIFGGSYYKHAYWNSDEHDLSSLFMEGEDTEFAFGASQEGWGSYKTNILLFTANNPVSIGVVHASVICNNIEYVANANVVLTSNSGVTYTGTTDNEGVCDIQDVPYGDYTVTVTATGYKQLTSTVTVENEETDLTLALKEDIPSTVNAMYLFDTGVVSGDAKIIAVSPWATSGSLQYALPEDVTNVKSAIVVVNSYSGSGNSNGYGLHSDVTLTTDSTITLGSEDLTYTGNQASDPTVYTINGHTTKQYSDYHYYYDITDIVSALNAGSSLTINVANSKHPNLREFDGRIKMIALFLAYDDGDNDNITYWLDVGQHWTTGTDSDTINTRSYDGPIDNLTLQNIALSSTQAKDFKLNNNLIGNPTVTQSGSFFINGYWNSENSAISDYFRQGSNTQFGYTNNGGSYKNVVILLTATEKEVILPDIAVNTLTTPWSEGIFAGVDNNLTIKINNNENDAVENVVVEVVSSEGDTVIATETIDSLSAGTTTLIINDPTIRDITSQTVFNDYNNNIVTYTVNVKYGDVVIDSKTYTKKVAYDGYLNKTYAYEGHDNQVNRKYTITGDVIIASQDLSKYADQFTRSRTETWDISLPEGAELVNAFLYFNYNWDTSHFPDGWTLTFNDAEITNDYMSFETDQGNLGYYGSYQYGLVVFDVSAYFIDGENTFEIAKTGNCALYPSTLMVLYDLPGSTQTKDVYFTDICDVLYGYYNEGYSGKTNVFVPYEDIDLTDMADATWYVFAGSASGNLDGDLSFNGKEFNRIWSSYSSDNTCFAYAADVSDVISEDNEAWYLTNPKAMTTVVVYEQVLVVTHEKPVPGAEIALTSEYTSVPSIYAGVVNNLTLKVTNNGVADSEDVLVNVFIGDELIGSQTIADYVVGETYTLNIVDSTIRPITENTIIGNNNENVVYTVVVEDANGPINSDDFSFVVVYDGNLGKDYAYPGANPTLREYSFVGDVIIANGNTYSAGAKTNRTDVLSVDLANGEVKEALLYISYNWDKIADGDFNTWNAVFNNQVIAPIASYRDQGNLGRYGTYGYGLVVYNVTAFVTDGENTFTLNKTSGNAAVYPTSLIVLVENPAIGIENSVYIVEEADLLSKSYNKNLDAIYSTAFDTVDGDATLYVFAAGAQAGEGDLVINGDVASNVWSGTSETFDMYEASVEAGSIAVDFVSTGSTILALHQMVLVQNALPGAEITLTSEYTSVPSIYAGVVNNLILKVTNNGIADSEDVLVNVFIGDELVGSQTITDYAVGETYTLNIVDSTIRPITENTINGNNNENVVYTVVVEDANGPINSDDFSFVVVYDGNLGKDFEYPAADPTVREYSFVGDVIVLTADGYSKGAATNRTDVFAVALDGNVKEALLYVSYNWDKIAGGDFNTWNTTFNGQVIAPIASYRDQGNLGRYGAYGYGLVVYNVTGLVADGDNSFAFNKTSGNAAVYPSSLIVLVDNPASAIENTVYIVEEADLLSKTYNKNLDAVYSTAFDAVDGDATLYVFAAGEGDLVINGDTVSDVWSGTSESFDTYSTSVDAGDIAVDFVSTGSTILALHQMVVVQNALPGAEITLTSEYTSVPSIYAGVVNNLTLKVTNNGVADSEDVLVNVFIGDELVGSGTIADYVAGETYTFNIVDSTIRPITENTVIGNDNENVVYTVVVEDANGAINSTDFTFVVVYNGNLGKDYEYPNAGPTLREFNITGDVIVLTNSTYVAGAATTRADVYNVEFDGSVSEALLYVPYTWDKIVEGDFNTWNITFNDNVIAPIASYRDQGNLGRYGHYGYGLVVYNVTEFVVSGENTVVLDKTAGNTALYPSSLIVFTDNPSSLVQKTVYIWEEADLLSKTYNKNLDAGFASSFYTIDGNATLYVFAASAQAGEGNLIVNDEVKENVWSGTSNSFDIYESPVVAGNITVKFEATGSTIVALHQMVVVENDKPVANLNADNLVMSYKDGSTWTVTLTDANNNPIYGAIVKVGINGKVYDKVTDSDGAVSLAIGLAPGNYTVNATFDSTNDYVGAFTTANITVGPAESILSADNLVMAYKDGSAWAVTLTDADNNPISGVNLGIGIKGKVYTIKTDADGIAKLPVNLAPGTYDINATFAGNKYYSEAFVSATVTVEKAVATLTASDLEMSYKDGSAWEVTLSDANGNVLSGVSIAFGIKGSTYNVKTDANGVAKLPINLAVGEYPITATLNNPYYEAEAIENTVTVKDLEADITASDVNMTYKDGTAYEVQLVDGEGNHIAVANIVVKITIKGTSYNVKTDANGIAKLPINLYVGTYDISAEYNGKEITNTIVVNKA